MPDYGLNISSKDQQPTQSITLLTAEDYAKNFIELQVEDSNYNHELSASQLWAIKKDGSFHLLTAHPDVYELLNTEEFNLYNYLGVIIHTTGWAAPLDEDGNVGTAPSKHLMRRRIGLAACVTDHSVGSAISFADDSEIITDPGSATGSLADALSSYWDRNSHPF